MTYALKQNALARDKFVPLTKITKLYVNVVILAQGRTVKESVGPMVSLTEIAVT